MRQWAMLLVLMWAILAAPALAAPPVQQESGVHIVQPGETLSAIARLYGLTVEELVALNGLLDPDRLQVGQRLLVAGLSVEDGTFYRVQPGDTLALLARRCGTTVETLARLNHLTHPHLIYVGQALLTPETGHPATLNGRVYVVQAGDTLIQIAARFGLSMWALAQANALTNPPWIQAGQRLWIPAPEEGEASLPLPFIRLEMLPERTLQGRTMQLLVETVGGVNLSGMYGDQPLFFVGEMGVYRTLIGIHAMAAPGLYPLALKAVQNGGLVSLRCMVQVVAGPFGVQYLDFADDKAQLLDPALVAAEAERIEALTRLATMPGVWQGPFAVPLAGEPDISTLFGVRRAYGAGSPVDGYHSGIDYSVDGGVAVYCPAPGRVVLAEPLQVRGLAVIVDHGRGVMSGYWHLSQVNVTAGQQVTTGDVLGLVGSTGLSTGPHLHWELRVMGVPVDPLQWVRESVQ